VDADAAGDAPRRGAEAADLTRLVPASVVEIAPIPSLFHFGGGLPSLVRGDYHRFIRFELDHELPQNARRTALVGGLNG